MSIPEQYKSAKAELIDSLRVVDSYIDGNHKPQSLTSFDDWIPISASKDVFIKNLSLFRPDKFAIALVHGKVGAKEQKHRLSETVELHIINGKVLFNNLEFTAGDRFTIPHNQEYSFHFLQDSYLTVKFIPRDSKNINNFNYGKQE